MEEVWRDIKGFEGLYQVSNLGRIKSLERTIYIGRGHKTARLIEEKIMGQRNHNNGYYAACLSDGRQHYFLIHRLVAQAFLDNPNGYDQINHKNENKKDNRLENLEWCNQSYNVRYNDLNIRGTAKRSKPVIQRTKDGKTISTWVSANEAGRLLGIHQGNISACCNGRIKTTGGYSFEYLNREVNR